MIKGNPRFLNLDSIDISFIVCSMLVFNMMKYFTQRDTCCSSHHHKQLERHNYCNHEALSL